MKKKYLLSVLLLAASFFAADCSAFTRYVTANLNLRYGPGTEYPVMSVIPKGTSVTIAEDCDCKWVPIEYCGQIGYISTRYLSSIPKKKYTKEIRRYSQRQLDYSVNRSISQVSQRYVRHYTNIYGERVQSPTYYNSTPAGATALCRDGTYSFSRSRRGTCSHHGGVARWL